MKILCLRRRIFPFGFALPAGHLEVGEAPLLAVSKEIREETGVVIPTSRLIFVDTFDIFGDSCRRGSDHHRWHLFVSVLTSQPTPRLVVNDEASSAIWMNVEEIKRSKKVSLPLRYIIDIYWNRLVEMAKLSAHSL